jgi:hypothetical protein
VARERRVDRRSLVRSSGLCGRSARPASWRSEWRGEVIDWSHHRSWDRDRASSSSLESCDPMTD